MDSETALLNVRRHYGRIAADYEALWPDYIRVQNEWVMARIRDDVLRYEVLNPDNAGPHVIDLGCGTGLMLQQVRDAYPGARLTGIDASAAMLDRARARVPDANFRQGDVADPATLAVSGQADIVLSLSVLHHLPDAGPHIEGLCRLVRPGGTVILADFARAGLMMYLKELWMRWTQRCHAGAMSPAELRQKLDRHFQGGHQGSHQGGLTESAVLHAPGFWRIQVYRLRKG